MKKLFTSLIGIILLCVSTHAYAVTDSFTNPEDSYVRETSPTQNYGTETTLIADGVAQDPDTGTYGEVVTLIQWDVSSIPSTATVTGVSVTLNYSDASAAPYNFYGQNTVWSEGSVTWNDLDQDADILGSVPPFSFNTVTHTLNADGIALVQGWVDGSITNGGFILRSGGTNNGIIMDSKESGGTPPTLKITYTDDGNGPPTINQLLTRIEQLEALLAGVSRTDNKIIFEGMNVQIVNGLGTTNGNPDDPDSTDPEITVVNGLGNLLIGYDEPKQLVLGSIFPYSSDKTGSHNIVVGKGHSYPSFGGLVSGSNNLIYGPSSSVTGGYANIAWGNYSSISGGGFGYTEGNYSSITGGSVNRAIGEYSNVNGGIENLALSKYSIVSGGFKNIAGGEAGTISGGRENATGGFYSHVSGGWNNEASGFTATVFGGIFNKAEGAGSSIMGGRSNTAIGGNSSVSGGDNNIANGVGSTVNGGISNTASGQYSTVSGGQNRTASGEFDWVAGSLFEDN